MIACALEANGAQRVYIIGRRLEVLEKAAQQAVRTKTIVDYLSRGLITHRNMAILYHTKAM